MGVLEQGRDPLLDRAFFGEAGFLPSFPLPELKVPTKYSPFLLAL